MSKHKFTLPDGTESVNCKERGSYARCFSAFGTGFQKMDADSFFYVPNGSCRKINCHKFVHNTTGGSAE